MSRYVDIDEMGLRKTISLGGLSAKALWRMIRQQPSIDIVRCEECELLEDCRNDDWQESVIERGYIGWCCRASRLGDVDYVKADDFCSYGERREP